MICLSGTANQLSSPWYANEKRFCLICMATGFGTPNTGFLQPTNYYFHGQTTCIQDTVDTRIVINWALGAQKGPYECQRCKSILGGLEGMFELPFISSWLLTVEMIFAKHLKMWAHWLNVMEFQLLDQSKNT